MIQGDQLLVPHTELVPSSLQGFAEAVERAQRRILEPRAKNTQRVYRQAWHQWDTHCEALGREPWPLDPLQLTYWLDHRQDLAPNSVRTYLSALCARDLELRIGKEEHPLSVRTHPTVIRWLQGWGQENSREPRRQAAAMSRAQLVEILEAAQQRGRRSSSLAHLPRYTRDRCLLLFGMTGGFRGDELVRLDLADVTQGLRGLDIRVLRSKTRKGGRMAHFRGLYPQGQILRCPVDAWHQWLKMRGGWEGPAFVPIRRNGELEHTRLSVESIRDMVVARAAAAGVKLSSHSLRASFVTMARQKGKPLDRIAAQADMGSLETVRRYCRQIEIWEDNPSAGVLDD